MRFQHSRQADSNADSSSILPQDYGEICSRILHTLNVHFIIEIPENRAPWKGSAAKDSVGWCATFAGERMYPGVVHHPTPSPRQSLKETLGSLLRSRFGFDKLRQVGAETA